MRTCRHAGHSQPESRRGEPAPAAGNLKKIWEASGDGADLERLPPVPLEDLRPLATTAEEHFYLAMIMCGARDLPAAAALAEQASQEAPDCATYREAARYLRRRMTSGEEPDVYATPDAFTAFAAGGGNVELYQSTHQALRACYAEQPPERLLDIGSGEGHGLLPALTAEVGHVDFIEPSTERGALVAAELSRRRTPHHAYPMTAQEFMTLPDVGPWDLVQETFALLALSRQDRVALFHWLRPRAQRLALVEFDVPMVNAGLRPDWFRHVISRYEQGIREYDEDRDLVAQGFLAPVMLGALGADRRQHHHELPIGTWMEDLVAAGFQPESPRPVHDYWWAPAYLVTAR